MDKRYQVFLSSTYADLKEERQRVIQTLMEMDCIPSGMELFPAADEEQWEFIKKIIDDCDYYLLIIGGRYGSTTPEGIGYTEKEYDYAIEKGLRVVAFLHEDPDSISAGKTDKDPELSRRLNNFREKVQQNRLVKYWRTAAELPGLVSLSLSKTIKTYPAVGWVRATGAGSTELLSEINTLRKENEELRAKLSVLVSQPVATVDDIAGMSESIELHGGYKLSYNYDWRPWKLSLTWNQIFALIAPYLLEHPSDGSVQITLRQAVLKAAGISYYESKLEDQDFQTVKLQLKAYGLIELRYTQTTKGGMALFWNLTERGESLMVQLRALRKGG
jgi:hypothetical protein